MVRNKWIKLISEFWKSVTQYTRDIGTSRISDTLLKWPGVQGVAICMVQLHWYIYIGTFYQYVHV